MLGAGGPGPAMSAHLATPPYVSYPGAARYGDYCWFSAGSMDSVPAEEAPAPDALSLPSAKTPSPSGTRSGCPGWVRPCAPGLGGDAGAAGGGRGSVGGEGRREPGAAAGGASVAAVPRRDGPKGRIEAACAHLTSPRCAAHGRGAPASPQDTRDL